MNYNFFFGYGSLVNRRTHTHRPTHPARVRGWRRAWRCVPERPLAFLTAVPDSSFEIEGLVAEVPPEGWAALDQREEFYDRHSATEDVSFAAPDGTGVVIYAVPQTRAALPDRTHPVLLSYLDVVLQGYLDVFGEDGAERFFATTEGWEAPILNDRAAPLYPRAQELDPDTLTWVDDAIARHRLNLFTRD